MAVQENTNITTDFAKAQSIDFVNRFTGGIKKLQEMLGITRRQALSEGSTIKTYKRAVTLADGNVAEGDLIPLSKVEKTPDKTYELAYKKYRKAVTMEAIQRSGFDQAVQEQTAPCCGRSRATSAANLRPSWQTARAQQPENHAGSCGGRMGSAAGAVRGRRRRLGHHPGEPDGRFCISWRL